MSDSRGRSHRARRSRPTTPPPDGRLLRVLIDALMERGAPFERLTGGDGLRLTVTSDSGTFHCLALVDEGTEQVAVYAILPTLVPVPDRVRAAEYLMRANHGLPLGNFELDFRDGEVRFKASADVEGGTLTTMMAGTLFDAAFAMVDHYADGLMRVLYSGVSPEEAVRSAELGDARDA